VTTGAPASMSSSYKGVAGRGWYTGNNPNESYWDSPKAANVDNMRLLDRGPLSVVVTSTGQIGGSKPDCTMAKLASSPVKLKLITDGTSKTLLIGEYTTTTQPSGTPPYSRSAFWANSVFGLNLANVTLPDSCRTNPMGCTNWADTAAALDPSFLTCATQLRPVPPSNFEQPCRRTFAGYHGGGNSINFVHVDGSVHRYPNTMDIRILAAMATIGGNESFTPPP
jgi:hypothetical protein